MSGALGVGSVFVWQGGAVPADIRDGSVPVAGVRAQWSWAERVARHRAVSKRLAALDDSHVGAVLEEAAAATVGIGGTTTNVSIDGVPVFVKRVPLTDLERRTENVGSTANVFQLPMFYQYGIGSAGFGAWREVAVHAMTTRWVLDRRFHGFPLLYHWRVLPQPPQSADLGELERWVEHWDGDDAIRARLQSIGTASAAVALFMEHIPDTVDAWLTAQTSAGGEAAEAAYTFVHDGLQEGVEFMQGQGLTHFDAHFRNLLTDGHRLYFADFGLATHSGFDLNTEESAFVRRHHGYDRGYTVTHLIQWLASNLLNIPWPDSLGYVREHLPDLRDLGLPCSAARIVARHAPVAAVMGDFYRALTETSKRTPFPADDLNRAFQL